jgi:hypothetical protein
MATSRTASRKWSFARVYSSGSRTLAERGGETHGGEHLLDVSLRNRQEETPRARVHLDGR